MNGKIVQIIGPVIDAEFEENKLPEIYHALEVKNKDGKKVVCEVAKHLGSSRVRAIALSSTDGIQRGADVKNTGKQISVPVGKEVLGRLFNVLGEPIDTSKSDFDGDEVRLHKQFQKYWPIHRPAPKLPEQSTKTEVFETGIKVIDLLAPFIKGGKVGLFGGAGVGKTVL